MQLQLPFAALLAGVITILSAQVEAVPSSKRGSGSVTLPLKRLERSRDVHPMIFAQQHVNRSRKRLARMTGRQPPSDAELRDALEKRIDYLEEQELKKRFNRAGVPNGRAMKRINRSGFVGAESFRKGATKGGKKGGAGAAAAAGAGAGAAAGSGAGSGAASSAAATGVTVSNTPNDSDSLALDIEGDDTGYLATVQLGTPPQDFLLLMDSGSADLWVGSADGCQDTTTNANNCGNHNFLGTQTSSSFKATQNPFQVTYGTGAVSGVIVQDNVAIAGLQLNAHTFGVAQQETDDFASNDTPFDGLMGLAQSTLSEQKTATPIESLAQAGLVDAAIMGYKIPRLADNLKDGEITFGSADTSRFDNATLTTLDNVSQVGFWEANVDAFTVNGQDSGLTGRTAILDTGTTLVIAPGNDAATINNLITGSSQQQGTFLVPCNTQDSVALTFGGTTFAIDPRDIATQPLNDGSGLCVSGIQSGEVGANTEWLVGDVFLKNAYFITNVNDNTLSLAKLV